MSRIWCYDEPVFHGDALVGSEVFEITEEEILDKYWQFWSSKIIEKYGEDNPIMTRDNCIDDWVVANWAWEKK